MERKQKIRVLKAIEEMDRKSAGPRIVAGGAAALSGHPVMVSLGAVLWTTGIFSRLTSHVLEEKIKQLEAKQAARPWENTQGIPQEPQPRTRRTGLP